MKFKLYRHPAIINIYILSPIGCNQYLYTIAIWPYQYNIYYRQLAFVYSICLSSIGCINIYILSPIGIHL